MLGGLFVLFFVGGPLIYRGLTRAKPTVRQLRKLRLLMGIAALAALAIRYTLPEGAMDPLYATTGSLLFIWLAWVAMLALGTQMLRRSDGSHRMRRWTGVIGAMGTTVPWFGLAAADMVGW